MKKIIFMLSGASLFSACSLFSSSSTAPTVKNLYQVIQDNKLYQQYFYDSTGRFVDSLNTYDTLGNVTTHWDYAYANNKLSVANYRSSNLKDLPYRYQYTLNAQGLVTKRTQTRIANDSLLGSTSYEYDNNNHAVKVMEFNSSNMEIYYEANVYVGSNLDTTKVYTATDSLLGIVAYKRDGMVNPAQYLSTVVGNPSPNNVLLTTSALTDTSGNIKIMVGNQSVSFKAYSAAFTYDGDQYPLTEQRIPTASHPDTLNFQYVYKTN